MKTYCLTRVWKDKSNAFDVFSHTLCDYIKYIGLHVRGVCFEYEIHNASYNYLQETIMDTGHNIGNPEMFSEARKVSRCNS